MRWLEKEVELLKTYRVKGNTYEEIAELLGKTKSACEKKHSRLNLTSKVAPWSENDIEVLKTERLKANTYKDIGTLLGRSESSCQSKAEALGITNRYSIWTNNDSAKLKDLVENNINISDISKIINKTEQRCINKCKELGIDLTANWNPAEISILINSVNLNIHIESIAKYVDKTVESCEFQLNRLKLVKEDYNNYTPTVLYLIFIPKFNLYKIGITKRNIKTRFGGYNNSYEIKDYIILSNEDAIYFEKLIINSINNNVSSTKGIGYTEMFINNDRHLNLQKLIKDL